MPFCEHFIYTAGKIGTREGYQVVAKSEGISDEITTSLLEYMYPIGVKVDEFIESKSLLILDKNKVAYSIVKNIGIGYDGRRGTLYNHTFVISKEDFEKLYYDSRVFDEHFIQNSLIKGQLPAIKIDSKSKLPNLELLQKLDTNTLKEILHALFKRSKIALVKMNDIELIQNLLAILPPPLRLISFSTMVIEPDKQYKFDFIEIPERAQNKLGKNFLVINSELIKTSPRRDDVFSESIQSLVDIVKNKDVPQLEKMFKDFEKISVQVSQIKKIELKEIFTQGEFESLSGKENFDKLKQKIQNLYSSKTFTQAPTRVIVSITKKIRKIVERALKRQKKPKTENENDLNQLLSITKILLDCMYYMRDYSTKKISKSTKNEISLEINKLEEIMNKYTPPKIAKPYTFDVYEYMKTVFEQTVNYWLLPLWLLWKK
ncbi:MAG: hypothetical protein HY222_01650 [Thaumarchaeota archaeon]|nr:hypothetical protein [Nitrososphaerota archaeon]MBI3641079.1 hypothetical protein [Nitrososphaerota archaeon]